MSVGENVKRLREAAKLTQQELADKVGVGRTYIAQIERGAKCPSIVFADELSAAIGCDIKEFLK